MTQDWLVGLQVMIGMVFLQHCFIPTGIEYISKWGWQVMGEEAAAVVQAHA